jgi:sugar phosphate isomerase/epimerase
MKVGVFSAILSGLPLDQALRQIAGLGCETVEIGTGAFPGNAHCKPDVLLGSGGKLQEFQAAIAQSGLEISSLSCHGNPIHPDAALAGEHHAIFQATVQLAAKLGVEVVTTFSGCPGDGSPQARYPNWVTCPWPHDFGKILAYQWDEIAVPYWREQAKFAADHGVRKIAIEAHPGFLVYNPATMLRLRDAAGEVVGCNLDPSHFFWQGIDPVKAVRKLGAAGAIHHVHAKDTQLYPVNADYDGYLDTKPYTDEANRAWIFRTVGYGHGEEFWCDFVSTLRMVGYDGTFSMEHEDSLMSAQEGLCKGVEFLQKIILRETRTAATWT